MVPQLQVIKLGNIKHDGHEKNLKRRGHQLVIIIISFFNGRRLYKSFKNKKMDVLMFYLFKVF